MGDIVGIQFVLASNEARVIFKGLVEDVMIEKADERSE